MPEKRERIKRVLNTKHTESRPETQEQLEASITQKLNRFRMHMDMQKFDTGSELERSGGPYARLGNLAWAIETLEEEGPNKITLSSQFEDSIDAATIEYVLGDDSESLFAQDCQAFIKDGYEKPTELIEIIQHRFEKIVERELGESFP